MSRKIVTRFSLPIDARRSRQHHARDKKPGRDGASRFDRLALAGETVQQLKNELRDAVYRSLHDGPQDEALLRLRSHASGDRALAQDGPRRAAVGHGDIAGADDRSWARTHGAASEARVTTAATGAAP